MNRKIVVTIGLVAVSLLALYAASLYAYFATDASYERLVSERPATRAQVEMILSGFHRSRVTDRHLMNVEIEKAMTPAMHYERYTKYGMGGGIDVVYGSQGEVVAIWPNYE